jgi:hypothetical protein
MCDLGIYIRSPHSSLRPSVRNGRVFPAPLTRSAPNRLFREKYRKRSVRFAMALEECLHTLTNDLTGFVRVTFAPNPRTC